MPKHNIQDQLVDEAINPFKENFIIVLCKPCFSLTQAHSSHQDQVFKYTEALTRTCQVWLSAQWKLGGDNIVVNQRKFGYSLKWPTLFELSVFASILISVVTNYTFDVKNSDRKMNLFRKDKG